VSTQSHMRGTLLGFQGCGGVWGGVGCGVVWGEGWKGGGLEGGRVGRGEGWKGGGLEGD
jgi:hypothetical protein